MNEPSAAALRKELERLERQVDTLVRYCARLEEENRVLQESQTALNTERANLLEKNELARSRIEAMISRLKSMEHS